MSKYNTPHDFLRGFQNCLKNFSSSIRADFRGEGASDAPLPKVGLFEYYFAVKRSVEIDISKNMKLKERNKAKEIFGFVKGIIK